jgi:hypothetical protein
VADDDPKAVAAQRRALMQARMATGGPREALKRFFLVGGEANWASLHAGLHERMLRGAETLLSVDRGTFECQPPERRGARRNRSAGDDAPR